MGLNKRIYLYTSIGMFILFFSCSKEENSDILYMNLNPWIEYGSMNDCDGNTYKTIQIGTQTWMARNLKTTKYNDGASIPIVTDALTWRDLSTPACCWQNNDPVRKVTYGVLYNWYTVNTGRLCPAGWHIPNDAEWTILTDFLGGENVAGGKLKESGFSHWNSPNTGATDEHYFKALPGGIRLADSDESFSSLFELGCWWTATSTGDWASSRTMDANSYHVQKSFFPKKCGVSVRCVMN